MKLFSTMILASTALVLLATPALAQKPGAALNRAPAVATMQTQLNKPTTVAPTVGGTPVARSAMGGRFGGAFGGIRSLGVIECTTDVCTCHGDEECNDMFSGAYCKWPTGPITPGDECHGSVCTCKRL